MHSGSNAVAVAGCRLSRCCFASTLKGFFSEPGRFCALARIGSTIENLINQTFGANIFHIHLQRRFHQRRYRHLNPVLLMPLSLDAIVDQGNQPRCHNGAMRISVDVPISDAGIHTRRYPSDHSIHVDH